MPQKLGKSIVKWVPIITNMIQISTIISTFQVYLHLWRPTPGMGYRVGRAWSGEGRRGGERGRESGKGDRRLWPGGRRDWTRKGWGVRGGLLWGKVWRGVRGGEGRWWDRWGRRDRRLRWCCEVRKGWGLRGDGGRRSNSVMLLWVGDRRSRRRRRGG